MTEHPVQPENQTHLAYRIDAEDRLCTVNPAWREFALDNGGSASLADGELGTTLWSHIAGSSVREIYRQLAARARAGRPVRFSYRCDSPTLRRTFAMTIRAAPGGAVDFRSELITAETRPSVRLLESATERSDEFLRVCAWCQRVSTDETTWLEVEDAVNRLGLLRAERLPGLTHTMCQDCGVQFRQTLGN